MKVDYLPLVIALVAAAASLTGMAYTQYGAVRLERQKVGAESNGAQAEGAVG